MKNTAFAAPSIDAIMMSGGLDQITPSLSLKAGVARQALNFECAVTGGYTRIYGYERFDGHDSPTTMSNSGSYRYISVTAYTNIPVVGDILTASGGATGTIVYVDGLIIVVAKITGTWAESETVAVGATPIGTINNVYAGPVTAEQDANVKSAVADLYRADISAVPGSGPIRGVVEFNDTVYAFRDNAGATALDIYKSSAAGWVNVPLYKTVSFTAGGATAPVEGATLTKGGVTSVVKRIVLTSGTWASNTAAGQLIITTPSGGNFSAGAATIGAVNVTLAGAQTQLALAVGGRFEFEEHNFFGQTTTTRIYGCDGVNKAFEFDGDILAPITTGAANDKPTHLACHAGYLFLSIGSSAIHSGPGLPYEYTAIAGAGELATGSDVTGMISMTGGTTAASLAITSRNSTGILYGSSPSDWKLVSYNFGFGVVPYSLKNMAQTYMFDDRGVNALATTQAYGNFAQSALTNSVLPFISERSNKMTATTLCRKKSQYRVFFDDGFGLFVTVVNNKLMGSMPVFFPNKVSCTYEGKKNNGEDVIYFGSDNGMIYQMEKGTSFDGEVIDYYFTSNYANSRSPRTLKRYRKAIPEITAELRSFITFNMGYQLGYDSPDYSQPDPAPYSQFAGRSKWDTFTWDAFFWDTKSDAPLECGLEGTAENIAFIISGSSKIVAPFTINSILIHYSPRRLMR